MTATPTTRPTKPTRAPSVWTPCGTTIPAHTFCVAGSRCASRALLFISNLNSAATARFVGKNCRQHKKRCSKRISSTPEEDTFGRSSTSVFSMPMVSVQQSLCPKRLCGGKSLRDRVTRIRK